MKALRSMKALPLWAEVFEKRKSLRTLSIWNADHAA